MELWTEQLIHRGDRNNVRSDQPTRFKRKDLSGTAHGFTYEAETGRLELLKDVNLKIQDEDNPATLIKSARAEATKEDGLLKFLGGVEVTQGNDRLKSDRLVVNFAPEDRVIHRAQAIDDVELWTSGATQVPGMTQATTGSGARHLKCRRLDLWFRPDRTLQQAVAGPNADLTLLPGPKDPPERKRLRVGRAGLRLRRQGPPRGAHGPEEHRLHHGSDPAGQGRAAHAGVQAVRGQDRSRDGPGHHDRVPEGRGLLPRAPARHRRSGRATTEASGRSPWPTIRSSWTRSRGRSCARRTSTWPRTSATCTRARRVRHILRGRSAVQRRPAGQQGRARR